MLMAWGILLQFDPCHPQLHTVTLDDVKAMGAALWTQYATNHLTTAMIRSLFEPLGAKVVWEGLDELVSENLFLQSSGPCTDVDYDDILSSLSPSMPNAWLYKSVRRVMAG